MNPEISRLTWRALEPVHAMVYFAPEPQEEYAAIGLDPAVNRAVGYFPARAAALGVVPWQVVHACFYNFSELAVQFGITGAWEIASPDQVIAARLRGADRALQRLCGDLLADTGAIEEAVDLARTAVGGCTPYGRPLYAAHASLPWPEPLHLQLWHAIALLREFRGDGHIAALVVAGLTGLEAAILHVAQGDQWSRKALQSTRAYSDQEWDAAVQALHDRGWLELDGAFTEQGKAERQQVENQTDLLALPAWERLGEAGCTRLRELVQPLSTAVHDNGGMPMTKPV